MKFDKKLYSKESIQNMIFESSLLKEYKELIETRNSVIGGVAGIAGLILVGLPFAGVLYLFYSVFEDGSIKEVPFGTILGVGVGTVILGIIAFIIVFISVAFIVDKIIGKVPPFREFSEPILLGYELALKRFEVENKIQDYEFMFQNKEFFHGLHVVQALLKTRNMELENQLKMIPIEERNQQNELFQTILNRKVENAKQADWLEDQLHRMESL